EPQPGPALQAGVDRVRDRAVERGHFHGRAEGRLAEGQRDRILQRQVHAVALEQLVRTDAEDADQIALLAAGLAVVPAAGHLHRVASIDARRNIDRPLPLLHDAGQAAATRANVALGDHDAHPAAGRAGLLLREAEKAADHLGPGAVASSTRRRLRRRLDPAAGAVGTVLFALVVDGLLDPAERLLERQVDDDLEVSAATRAMRPPAAHH